MEAQEILQLYDQFERLGADYPLYRHEEGANTLRMISTVKDGHNFVIYSSVDESNADAVIESELAYFKSLGLSFEWKLYSHDRPADLKARLASHGFSIGGDEAIMALELSNLPAALAAEHPHDVRKVMDEKGFADYAAVNAQAWPEDNEAWMETMAATLRDESERMSAYVAYVEGKPVCAARIDFPVRSPFASIWGGATLEPYRKRGIYTAILSVRLKEAIARGYKFVTIDASPMSRPIVEKQGFHLLVISNPCNRDHATVS